MSETPTPSLANFSAHAAASATPPMHVSAMTQLTALPPRSVSSSASGVVSGSADATAAVGTYALLLAWNEYLYNFLMLSTPESMTVAVALAQFINSDESPWNFMMATAIIYALPPLILYYGFRRYMAAGLTMGGVKG